MFGERLDHRLVRLALHRPLTHIDGQLAVGAHLDQRALAASGLDLDHNELAAAHVVKP
jgi:hypothetical protein